MIVLMLVVAMVFATLIGTFICGIFFPEPFYGRNVLQAIIIIIFLVAFLKILKADAENKEDEV